MKRFSTVLLLTCMLFAASAFAQDDALGLYFSDTDFTLDTASTTIVPGFMQLARIVLTNPTGAVIEGYEVDISSSAPDFAIPMTSLTFDQNLGTNTNQIITFLTPVPAQATGTVLATIFFTTEITDPGTISFGASSPSSVGGAGPAVVYQGGPAQVCSQPYGIPVVAWLNSMPVAVEPSNWDGVKALFR